MEEDGGWRRSVSPRSLPPLIQSSGVLIVHQVSALRLQVRIQREKHRA